MLSFNQDAKHFCSKYLASKLAHKLLYEFTKTEIARRV